MSTVFTDIDPAKDGIDHINIYSKAATELGRFLSNFAYSPIEVGVDGKFSSIEGYWYWLLTGDERLRSKYGYQAKQLGREVLAGMQELPMTRSLTFQHKIEEALHVKMQSHPRWLQALRQCTLPLTHYYVYGGKTVVPKDWRWTVEFLDSMRGSP